MAELYITIGRQFGSGGREIGKKVAQALDIPYYDKEILAVAARESGLSQEFLKSYDEKPTNSFLYSLVMGQQRLSPGLAGNTVEQLAANAQRDAVLSVAAKGSCVIVGRCADYILRDKPGLLRVFICADHDARIARVVHRDGQDPRLLLQLPYRPEMGRCRKLRPVRQLLPPGSGWSGPGDPGVL